MWEPSRSEATFGSAALVGWQIIPSSLTPTDEAPGHAAAGGHPDPFSFPTESQLRPAEDFVPAAPLPAAPPPPLPSKRAARRSTTPQSAPAAGEPPRPQRPFAVGDALWARWRDGAYYYGTIARVLPDAHARASAHQAGVLTDHGH